MHPESEPLPPKEKHTSTHIFTSSWRLQYCTKHLGEWLFNLCLESECGQRENHVITLPRIVYRGRIQHMDPSWTAYYVQVHWASQFLVVKCTVSCQKCAFHSPEGHHHRSEEGLF